MSENLRIFNQLKETPNEARTPIKAGRLNGFTDINTMWRLKRLTEVFGPCGIGWKYEITNQRIIPGNGSEIAAFVDVLLFYKENGKWSAGVPGIGGSAFVQKEKNGYYTSNECFKMALSDAIGTACKALGMSADIYFSKDRSKYNQNESDNEDGPDTQQTKTQDDPFERAKHFVFKFGPYTGRELQDVWRSDINYVRLLKSDANTPGDALKSIQIFAENVMLGKK